MEIGQLPAMHPGISMGPDELATKFLHGAGGILTPARSPQDHWCAAAVSALRFAA